MERSDLGQRREGPGEGSGGPSEGSVLVTGHCVFDLCSCWSDSPGAYCWWTMVDHLVRLIVVQRVEAFSST